MTLNDLNEGDIVYSTSKLLITRTVKYIKKNTKLEVVSIDFSEKKVYLITENEDAEICIIHFNRLDLITKDIPIDSFKQLDILLNKLTDNVS